MISALVVMTILGCDDSVSQCHYISTVHGTWETVATCDAESQKQLPKFTNSNYPVVVAMCDTADKRPETAQPDIPESAPPLVQAAPQPPLTPAPGLSAVEEKPALPKRALALISGSLPDMAKLRSVVVAPVHSVQNGYSWVARKFAQ